MMSRSTWSMMSSHAYTQYPVPGLGLPSLENGGTPPGTVADRVRPFACRAAPSLFTKSTHRPSVAFQVSFPSLKAKFSMSRSTPFTPALTAWRAMRSAYDWRRSGVAR